MPVYSSEQLTGSDRHRKTAIYATARLALNDECLETARSAGSPKPSHETYGLVEALSGNRIPRLLVRIGLTLPARFVGS